jgi:hypothetical protein
MRRTVKQSKKQALWDYMRRNKAFCIKQMKLSVSIDMTQLKNYIYHLEATGYIKRADENKNLIDRCYRFVKDTGKISPKVHNGEVYDYNLKKSFYIKSKLNSLLNQVILGIEAQEKLLEMLLPHELLDLIVIIRKSKKIDRVKLVTEFTQKHNKEAK